MVPQAQAASVIAGSVLPIRRAEELLGTLPGVIAARIVAAEAGQVEEIHVLTTTEVTPKQTVRNIESALIAHLGMRVDHRKISVATSVDARRSPERSPEAPAPRAPEAAAPAVEPDRSGRRIVYFEDVEVRRSRMAGLTCRVTLVRGEKSFIGEAEGMENERSRIELAARAALRAMADAMPEAGPMDLAGAKLVDAFDRGYVFVGVTAQRSRTSVVLTGTGEVTESPETASVLAVLDATNRWLSR